MAHGPGDALNPHPQGPLGPSGAPARCAHYPRPSGGLSVAIHYTYKIFNILQLVNSNLGYPNLLVALFYLTKWLDLAISAGRGFARVRRTL